MALDHAPRQELRVPQQLVGTHHTGAGQAGALRAEHPQDLVTAALANPGRHLRVQGVASRRATAMALVALVGREFRAPDRRAQPPKQLVAGGTDGDVTVLRLESIVGRGEWMLVSDAV